MTRAEYLVAGHSHIFPMGAPANYSGPVDLVKALDGFGYFVMEPWNGQRSIAYWDKLVESSAGRDVLIAYNGNQHHGAFLFAPEDPFDFFDERVPKIIEGATIVPKRLVEAFFDPSLHELRRLLPRLLTAGARSVRIVGTPPPKSDILAFSDMIRASPFAKSFAAKNKIDLASAGITPSGLLLKLWHVIEEMTARVAVGDHAAFVAVPPEARDTEGFLAKRFYSYTPSDITHANREFGQLMARVALETLGSS
jgi:hypothetical protein